MLTSDVSALDRLISDDLMFTDHLGRLLSKQADLKTHRSGTLKFHMLEPSEQLLQVDEQPCCHVGTHEACRRPRWPAVRH